MVGGTFVAVKMHGKRVDDMILKYPVAMKCAFGENPKRVYGTQKKMPMTRMGTSALLRDLLARTVEYDQAWKDYKADPKNNKKPAIDVKLEAMLPVIHKEIPLKAHAHRADDILHRSAHCQGIRCGYHTGSLHRRPSHRRRAGERRARAAWLDPLWATRASSN